MLKLFYYLPPNDDLALFQTIDFGIVEFLKKPVNIGKLTETLNKAILQIDILTKCKQCYYDINSAFDKSIDVGLINNYNGIPIQSDGTIVAIKDDEFTVKVSKIQILAIKNERNSVIKFKSTKKYIYVYVVETDENLNLITFTKPKYIDFKVREFQYKRIAVDRTFKVGMYINNQNIDLKPIDVSFVSIAIYTENYKIEMKLNQEIALTLGFEISSPTVLINEKKFVKMFLKGKIIRIIPYKSGFQIVTSLNVKKTDESTFHKYLKEREMEILKEFKLLLKR